MTGNETNDLPGKNLKFPGKSYLILASGSLCALVVTFLASNADFTFQTKAVIFSSVIFLYLAFGIFFYVRQKKELTAEQYTRVSQPSKSIFSPEIEVKLLALEEANQFFGASLKSADMFRLVTSRIHEIIPFAACALFIADEEKENLRIVCAVGDSLKKFVGMEINSQKGLAGKTFQSQISQVDKTLQFDKNAISAEALKDLSSAIAVPLLRGENAFGVLVLYGEREHDFNQSSIQLLEAVASRVTPLFLSSQAFESSLANALTDTLTNLPNERAFFLVLENQIAESQRFRDERPLTILALDIRNFDEHNQRLGHATGDRLLVFAADKIKNQLRQMDFLARSMNDEFLAVLPTASDEITREIIERVEKIFVSNPFEVSPQEKIHLQLNVGAASFLKDGETAGQLLKHAVLRKQQSKSNEKENNILWFPKDYVN